LTVNNPTLIEFTTDTLRLDVSPAQAVVLTALDRLPLTPEQADVWRACTKREPLSTTPREWSLICGARSGKGTRLIAPTVLHRAIYGDYPTERGVPLFMPIVSMDARGAANLFAAVRDYALSTRVVANHLIDEPKQDAISFDTGVTVAVFPSISASLRSWTIPLGVMDEFAFMGTRDTEIQASIRRGGLTFGSRRLPLKATTPWAKTGLAWQDMQRLGQNDPHAVTWHASTSLMNPSIDPADLDAERSLDPTRFAREYEALFIDLEDVFLPSSWVDAAIAAGVFQREPERGVRYVAAVDPSGGGADAFVLSIVFRDANSRIVQAVLKGARRVGNAAPNLEAVVADFAATAKRYGCSEVTGDRYSANWVVQSFARHGIRYNVSDRDRSKAYLETKALFAEQKIILLDHADQAEQFRRLEVKHHASGATTVDHPANFHDDFSNCTALAAATLVGKPDVQYRIWRFDPHTGISTRDRQPEPELTDYASALREVNEEGR
jgi:hypothetical protein